MVAPENRGNQPHQGSQGFGGQPGQGQNKGQGGATGVMEAVREQAGNLASNVGETAQQAWESTRQGVGQMASQVSDTAGDAFTSVRNCMGRYPFATFFVGFGLGMLVMMAIDRRRS